MRANRAHLVPLQLIDGGLVNVRRDETVKRMAADLVAHDAVHDKRRAVNCLLSLGYPSLEVALYLDNARQAAFQQTVDIVAWEMAKP
jgi:hypothetical protein